MLLIIVAISVPRYIQNHAMLRTWVFEMWQWVLSKDSGVSSGEVTNPDLIVIRVAEPLL